MQQMSKTSDMFHVFTFYLIHSLKMGSFPKRCLHLIVEFHLAKLNLKLGVIICAQK